MDWSTFIFSLEERAYPSEVHFLAAFRVAAALVNIKTLTGQILRVYLVKIFIYLKGSFA